MGYEFEIFAERHGRWFGCCLYDGQWRAGAWTPNGIGTGALGLDIPAPEPVRKWRWVMMPLHEEGVRVGNDVIMWVTAEHYSTACEAEKQHCAKAIQRIDATEITE